MTVLTGTQPLFMPRGGPRNQVPVILSHPANTLGATWATNLDQLQFACRLAAAGFCCYAPDLGGPAHWGNDNAVAGFSTARAVLTAADCRPDRVSLVGTSMGVLAGLNYMRADPTAVHAVVSVAGIPALEVIRDLPASNPNPRDQIAAAWGKPAGSTSATAPLPAHADPAAPANLTTILTSPAMRRRNGAFYYSTADTSAGIGFATAAATATGLPAVPISNTLGHTGALFAVLPIDDVIDILHAAAA